MATELVKHMSQIAETDLEADVPVFEEPDEFFGNQFDNAHLLSCEMTSTESAFENVVTELMDLLKIGGDGALVSGRAANIRTNLKLLIINALRVHRQDPTAYIAVNRNKNKYRKNPWGLSFKIVEIIDSLFALGLIDYKGGFRTPKGQVGSSRISRIRPTKLFVDDYLAPIAQIRLRADRSAPMIILKDNEKKYLVVNLEGETVRQNNAILSYLDLLESNDIDVSREVKQRATGVLFDQITVRRVFNRSSYELGGRVYGPWWQKISEEDRAEITINGEKTVELDYEAQHMNHVYARAGVSVYDHTKGRDPYAVPGFPRDVVKSFTTIAINAEDEESAYFAMRKKYRADPVLQKYVTTRRAFESLRNAVLAVHPLLKEKLFSDLGVEFQYEDSEICMEIIDRLTTQEIPVLTVHDSFIVPVSKEAELRKAMLAAYSNRDDHLKRSIPKIK